MAEKTMIADATKLNKKNMAENLYETTNYVRENMALMDGIITGIAKTITIRDTMYMERPDLIQEGWLILWEKLGAYDPNSSSTFENWAAVVIRNRLLDLARQDSRKRHYEERSRSIEERSEELHEFTPLSDYSRMPSSMDLWLAIEKLRRTEHSRTVRIGLCGIWNIFTGEFSTKEMAERFGVSNDHYNAAIRRARGKLQPLLADYFS